MSKTGSTAALTRTIENAVIARLVASYTAARRENDERRKDFNRRMEEYQAGNRSNNFQPFREVYPFVEVFSLLQTVRGAVSATSEAELFTVELFNRTLKQMERAGILCFMDSDGYGRNDSIAFSKQAEEAHMSCDVADKALV